MLVSAMLAIPRRAGRNLLAVGAVCALAAFAAPPAYAAWSFELGIGEQETAMFSDPRFTALGLEHVRVVVPYDVACPRGAALRSYVATWLAAAERAGAKPLVAFSLSWQRPRRKLPSYRTYLRCFRAFRARWPQVVDFNPWNEVNHWSQPTYRTREGRPASTTPRGGRVPAARSRPATCWTRATSPAGSRATAPTCADGRDSGRSTTTST